MEKIEDMSGNAAINKLKEVLEKNPVCMLISSMAINHPTVCPMTVKTIENNGDIWFLSYKDSEHYESIENDASVLLTFANNDAKEYLSITGRGIHTDSQEIIDALWDEEDNKWYKDGKDSENIVVLKVSIDDAYYWDQFEQKSKQL